jgi:hypothetical protein
MAFDEENIAAVMIGNAWHAVIPGSVRLEPLDIRSSTGLVGKGTWIEFVTTFGANERVTVRAPFSEVQAVTYRPPAAGR